MPRNNVTVHFASHSDKARVQIRANNNGGPGNQIGGDLTRVGTAQL